MLINKMLDLDLECVEFYKIVIESFVVSNKSSTFASQFRNTAIA